MYIRRPITAFIKPKIAPSTPIINRRLPPALLAVQRERLPQPPLYTRNHITNFVIVALFYTVFAVTTLLLVNPIIPAQPVLAVSWLKGIFDLLPLVSMGEERAQLLPFVVATESVYASLGTTMYLTALGFATLVLAFTSLRIADRAVDMMDADGEDLPLSLLFTKDGILFFALVIQVELFGNPPQKAEKTLQKMLVSYRASIKNDEKEQLQLQTVPQTPKTPLLPTPPGSSAEKLKKKSKAAKKKKQIPKQPVVVVEEQLVKKNSRNSIDNSDLAFISERQSFEVVKPPLPVIEPSEEEEIYSCIPEIEEEPIDEPVEVDEAPRVESEASAEDNTETEVSEVSYRRDPEHDETADDFEYSLNEEESEKEIESEVDEEESQEIAYDESHDYENQRSFTSIWEFGKHIDLLRGIYPTNPVAKTSIDSTSSTNSPMSSGAPPGFEEDDQVEELPFTERTSSRFLGYFTSKNRQIEEEVPSSNVSPRRVSMQTSMETPPPTAGAAWRWKLNSSNTQYPPVRPSTISIASPQAYPQAYSQDVSTWRNPAYHRRVSSATSPMPTSPHVTYAPPPYYNQAFSSLNVANRSGVRNNSSSFFATNASMMSNPENPNPYAPPKRNYSRHSSSGSSTGSYHPHQQQQNYPKEKRYYN